MHAGQNAEKKRGVFLKKIRTITKLFEKLSVHNIRLKLKKNE